MERLRAGAIGRPNLRDVVNAFVPNVRLPLLSVGGIAFAFVNTGLEELIWRGALQDGLEPVFGMRGAVALQAVSFGAQHLHGVPRGLAGVLLADVWAGMLGALRHHTRGLLAPFAAHVVADATIAVIILASCADAHAGRAQRPTSRRAPSADRSRGRTR